MTPNAQGPRTRAEIRTHIKKHIDDLLIPGCGREDDTGEPSYHKFFHNTVEDGCCGCEEKLIDWITDEILLALADERRKAVEECARVECRFCQYGWVVERALKEHGGRFYHINPDDEDAPEYCLSQGIRSLPASGTGLDKPR